MDSEGLLYARALALVEQGKYQVDPENGIVFGTKGRAIGFRSNGYIRCTLHENGKPLNVSAHRLIWECVYGPISGNMVVNHKNGIRNDNRILNLELVTNAENVRHAFSIGLNKGRPGITNPNAKFSSKDVDTVRELRALGLKQCKIAEHLGMSQIHVSRICRGEIRTQS